MVRKYKLKDKDALIQLVEVGAKTLLLNIEDILDISPTSVLVYEQQGVVYGFGFFMPFAKGIRMDICLVVDPAMRRQGIGTQIYNSIMGSINPSRLPAFFEGTAVFDDLPAQAFAHKMGYHNWFTLLTMVYNDELLPTPATFFEPYEEKYLDKYNHLLAQAFYPLRSKLDSKPHMLPPVTNTSYIMSDTRSTFLAINTEGTPIAAATISNGVIDNLAVLPEAQGYGFGRQISMFATNYALLSPTGYARLDVIEDNEKAVSMYKSLGYKVVARNTVYRKNI